MEVAEKSLSYFQKNYQFVLALLPPFSSQKLYTLVQGLSCYSGPRPLYSWLPLLG